MKEQFDGETRLSLQNHWAQVEKIDENRASSFEIVQIIMKGRESLRFNHYAAARPTVCVSGNGAAGKENRWVITTIRYLGENSSAIRNQIASQISDCVTHIAPLISLVIDYAYSCFNAGHALNIPIPKLSLQPLRRPRLAVPESPASQGAAAKTKKKGIRSAS